MKLKCITLLAATVTAALSSLYGGAALAQAKEQYFPALVYRTGAYSLGRDQRSPATPVVDPESNRVQQFTSASSATVGATVGTEGIACRL